jgi:hypothetical protein
VFAVDVGRRRRLLVLVQVEGEAAAHWGFNVGPSESSDLTKQLWHLKINWVEFQTEHPGKEHRIIHLCKLASLFSLK